MRTPGCEPTTSNNIPPRITFDKSETRRRQIYEYMNDAEVKLTVFCMLINKTFYYKIILVENILQRFTYF